ncbi:hypothetical protein HS125_00845 [bacterium]|nr:hypothetical protein [bacterium]
MLRTFRLVTLCLTWTLAGSGVWPDVYLLSAPGQLPAGSGPQADADLGDWVLSNRTVTAVVLGASTDRRIPAGFPMQRGDLIDFHITHFDHDQLIAYRFGWEGPAGAYATLLMSATAPPVAAGRPPWLLLSGRLYDPRTGELLPVDIEHELSLEADGYALDATTWLINRGAEPFEFTPCDGLYSEGLTCLATGEQPLAMFEARRPRYALGVYSTSGTVHIEPATPAMPWARLRFEGRSEPWPVPPTHGFVWSRRLVVKSSSALLLQTWAREHADFLSGLWFTLIDADRKHLRDVPVRLLGAGWEVSDRSSPLGYFSLQLPSGSYRLYAERPGCSSVSAEAELFEGRVWRENLTLPEPAVIEFTVVSGRRALPARARVFGLDGTPDPPLSLQEELSVHGQAVDSPDGRFRLFLPPGRYRALFSAGPEYELAERRFELKEGQKRAERVKLLRVVDTEGWIAACLYAQTRRSGTSLVSAPDRLLGLAADGVEFVVLAERERLPEGASALARAGLEKVISLCPGIELSHPLGFRLVAFPLDAEAIAAATGGAPAWSHDPYATLASLPAASPALTLRVVDSLPELTREARLVSLLSRHPREGVLLSQLLPADGASLSASQLLPLVTSLLGAGGAVGPRHADSGSPRVYLPLPPDDPADIRPPAVVAALSAGEVVLSNGPFIAVKAKRGKPRRGQAAAPVRVEVEVRAPEWIRIDEVAVVVADATGTTWSFSRSRDKQLFPGKSGAVFKGLEIDAAPGAWLLVWVSGPPGGMTKGTFDWDRRRPAALRASCLP